MALKANQVIVRTLCNEQKMGGMCRQAARTCPVGQLDRVAAHGPRLDLGHVQVAQRKDAERLEQLPRALHDREHHRRLEALSRRLGCISVDGFNSTHMVRILDKAGDLWVQHEQRRECSSLPSDIVEAEKVNKTAHRGWVLT